MKYFCSIVLLFLSLTCAAQSQAPYILVLGVSQDGGYPHMGCQKACCSMAWADATLRRYVVSLALVDPAEKKWWLFEATPDIKYQLHYFQALTNNQYNFLPDGIFITHAHIGHYTGLMELGKEVMGTRDIPVYVLPRLKKFLETNGPWSQLVNYDNIKLVELHERWPNAVDTPAVLSSYEGISVSALRVPHRDEYSETAGFIINTSAKRYLFIPDINKWDKWDQSIVAQVKQADIAFLDATFSDSTELPARNFANVPHPFVFETMRLFENESPLTKSKIYFIHFNHTNPILWSKEKQKDIEHAGYQIARQGEKL